MDSNDSTHSDLSTDTDLKTVSIIWVKVDGFVYVYTCRLHAADIFQKNLVKCKSNYAKHIISLIISSGTQFMENLATIKKYTQED